MPCNHDPRCSSFSSSCCPRVEIVISNVSILVILIDKLLRISPCYFGSGLNDQSSLFVTIPYLILTLIPSFKMSRSLAVSLYLISLLCPSVYSHLFISTLLHFLIILMPLEHIAKSSFIRAPPFSAHLSCKCKWLPIHNLEISFMPFSFQFCSAQIAFHCSF